MPKKGQCVVCLHRKCGAINRALIAGERPLAKIAQSFGVAYHSVFNHRLKHLPVELVKRKQESVEDATEGLVNALEQITQTTDRILVRAMAPKTYDAEVALKAIARKERQLELKARLLGQLEERSNSGPQTISVVYVDKQLITSGAPQMSNAALPAGREVRSESG
jgi:hypothetical protein